MTQIDELGAVDQFYKKVDDGRAGLNQGYSMGMPKLERVTGGVQRETYTLLFGGTGTGKTTLALYSYVYRPMMEHLDDGMFRCIYFSLEMSPAQLMAKLLGMYIFEHYAIEMSVSDMFSRKREWKMSDKHYKIIRECEPWLRKVEKILTIHDERVNANSFYSKIMCDLSKEGTFTEKDGVKTGYIANNPRCLTVVVFDHLNLVQRSKGNSLKEEIDTISGYFISLRKRCGISPVVIMQVNRDSTSMGRRKEGLNNLRLDDAKDSGSPANDCDIAITLFYPHREALSKYHEYDITCLRERFRVITCRKNRMDDADVEIGCAFYGRICWFEELPLPADIMDYSQYQTPFWIIPTIINDSRLLK